mgnify:CR=1 FL=1
MNGPEGKKGLNMAGEWRRGRREKPSETASLVSEGGRKGKGEKGDAFSTGASLVEKGAFAGCKFKKRNYTFGAG